MNDKEKLQLKKQHFDSYRQAVLDNIENNTNVLLDEDIMSLIKKPPLDSMDLIKSKFLSIAKKNKTVIKGEEIDKCLDKYRKDVISLFDSIKKDRIKALSTNIKKAKFKDDSTTISLLKKDFASFNRKNRKELRDSIILFLDQNVIKNLDRIFIDNDINNYDKVKKEMIKFLKNNYVKQLLDNIDIKVLIKDATLMNNVRELSERYTFTLLNSKLFE